MGQLDNPLERELLSAVEESDTSMASQSNLKDVSVDSLWVVGVRK